MKKILLVLLLLSSVANAQPMSDAGPRYFYELSSKPPVVNNSGVLYAKDAAGLTKLYYEDPLGNEALLVGGGVLAETDPVFVAAPAYGVEAGDIINWDAAYSHVSSNGTNHSYINQDVTTTSIPTFDSEYISTDYILKSQEPQPSAPTIVSTSSGGNISNESYKYYMVFVTSLSPYESTQLGVASNWVVVTSPNSTVNLTLPLGSKKVVRRLLYRYSVTYWDNYGVGVYGLVDTIDNNTTTSYSDTKYDDDLTPDEYIGTATNYTISGIYASGSKDFEIKTTGNAVPKLSSPKGIYSFHDVSGKGNMLLLDDESATATRGSYNTSLGYLADGGEKNNNTAIGYRALSNGGTSLWFGGNTAIGADAGRYATKSGNVFIGLSSGSDSGYSGSDNVCIGYASCTGFSQVDDVDHTIVIGDQTYATKDYQVVIGNSSIVETLLINTIISGKEPIKITQTAGLGSSPNAFELIGAAHTNLTTKTENIGFNLNFSATKTWDAGDFATQREVLIQAPTYASNAFAPPLTTIITTADTFAITGAPIAGTNMTITNPYSFHVYSGSSRFDGRVLNYQGSDVASTNNMTLSTGNYFDITGAVQINCILETGWTAGTMVYLQFDAAPTLKHNQACGAGYEEILGPGSSDYLASAGAVVMLIYNGDSWKVSPIYTP